jgi:hypothetical protein
VPAERVSAGHAMADCVHGDSRDTAKLQLSHQIGAVFLDCLGAYAELSRN